MGIDRVLDLLEVADWRKIILQLTYHTIFQFRRYSWKTKVPKGYSPEDFAISAIEKVFDGRRNWDPDKYPNLVKHLKWIVNSEIEHVFSSIEHQKTDCIQPVKNDDGADLKSAETVFNNQNTLIKKSPTPEEELISVQDKRLEENLIAQLRSAVSGDEDLELLFLCFEDGIDKPERIAAETGWDIKKVYNLKRKLLRIATKIGRVIREVKGEK